MQERIRSASEEHIGARGRAESDLSRPPRHPGPAPPVSNRALGQLLRSTAETRASGLGTGAAVSRRGDPLEREAEEVAGGTAPPPARLATGRPLMVDGGIPGLGPGRRLDPAGHAVVAEQFGPLADIIRIHTDRRAAEAARSIDATAFAAGRHVAFDAGAYAPGTGRGRRLLSHEAVHVAQAASGTAPPGLHARRTDGTDTAVAPPASTRASLAVSLGGLMLTPPPGSVFSPGPKLEQGVALLLRSLTGTAEAEQVAELSAYLRGRSGLRTSGLEGTADEGEPLPKMRVDAAVSVAVVRWLQSREVPVALSEDQRWLLTSGYYADQAWTNLRDERVQDAVGYSFPEWYDSSLFLQEIGRHQILLRDYVEAAVAHEHRPDASTREELIRVLNAIVDALSPGAFLLETIEHDAALVDEPGYRLLWPAAHDETADGVASASTGLSALGALLTFAHSQPDLVRTATAASGEEATGARRELLERFVRYFARLVPSGGDQQLTDAPGGANAPPHPATLSSSPPLQPPLFDAAVGPPHRFVMGLQFTDVFDALARYAYAWERVLVPDEVVAGRADISELQGERPGAGEVSAARFGTSYRYLQEDVQRTIAGLGGTMGVAPGLAATSLALANGLLRFAGTGFQVFADTLTQPWSEQQIVFPHPGLFLVRARVIPVLAGDEEVVRAPSVAYLPVFAREPTEMAEARVRLQVRADEAAEARRVELQDLLAMPMTHLHQEAMEAELAGLKAAGGTMADVLGHQLAQLRARRDELPAGAEDHRTLEQQIAQLESMLATRAARAARLRGAERLQATFVSDEGHTLQLAMEAAPTADGWYVSDLTTPKSHDTRVSGDDRAQALPRAVRTILEGPRGYGRGHCSLMLDGQLHTLRIAASQASILMEAVGNVATVVSIAAVAAAPFTGGASLAILLPVGLVGAVPSAYRLATDVRAGVFSFDLDTAMELVNIMGGVAGFTHVTTPLRYVRLGRAVMVVGLGSDGLGVVLIGAGLLQQIEALAHLPPGERASRTMQIMGRAMLDVGLMAGQSLTALRYRAETETAVTAAAPGPTPVRGVDAVVGRPIDAVPVDVVRALGYRKPYQRDGRWIIARRDASDTATPALRVGDDGVIRRASDPRPSGGTSIPLEGIPRPASYTDARLAAHLDLLAADRAALGARLSRLGEVGAVRGEVDAGLFRILKGNVAEILARPVQHDVLAQVRGRWPDAEIHSGLYMARVKPDGTLARPVLFSDNIIARIDGGNLHLLAVFEVKAGRRGGAEATSQIFEWIEGRLTDGDTLLLPDGSRYRYAPDEAGPGRVIGLASAQRHIIAPKGAEMTGTRSSEQVASAPDRRSLPLDAAELDYLVRRTVMELF